MGTPLQARMGSVGWRPLPVPDQRDDEFRVRSRHNGHRFHPVHTERLVHETKPVVPHGKFQRGYRGYPEEPVPLVYLCPGNRLDHVQGPPPALQRHPETAELRQRIGGNASGDIPFLAEYNFPSGQRRDVQGKGRGAENGSILVPNRDACRVRPDPYPPSSHHPVRCPLLADHARVVAERRRTVDDDRVLLPTPGTGEKEIPVCDKFGPRNRFGDSPDNRPRETPGIRISVSPVPGQTFPHYFRYPGWEQAHREPFRIVVSQPGENFVPAIAVEESAGEKKLRPAHRGGEKIRGHIRLLASRLLRRHVRKFPLPTLRSVLPEANPPRNEIG